ncbi:uncharacterized protein ACA1_223230 [Acanthamoeba castellanii str. Neff]|uniref:HEAT repeat domain containing protein n=1 Tax=Acanthamoeba castellanii (strain ATCC 30010 / Neff) TaxID=1257118 RepID=L8GVB8_ACACF|nr:uncharacterized protein ACA1_223230 [Acanthamoeba castellanii str. Neff]ELR16026.1 hypothetical protein ACA1_223230 [Acanthamoeba castellanii str. Neff]
MTQLYEFEDVRKLAAEVVAFLPPKLTLPAISQSLLRHIDEAALVHIKVDIYAICNALLVHGKAAHPFVIDLVPAILSLLKLPIPSSSTGSLEVQKLQHACIDFLALVTLTARQPALREGADLLPLLLHFVCTGRASRGLEALSSSSSSRANARLEVGEEQGAAVEEQLSPSFRICAINVLITLAKGIGLSVLQALGAWLIPQLLVSYFAVSGTGSTSHEFGLHFLRAAHLQLLFTIAYQLKGEFRGEGKELLAAAVHALQDPAPEVVRMAGMKLLGAVLSSPDAEELFLTVPTVFYQVQAGLRTLAQGDPSAEARQLADQLLSVAFAFSPPAPTPTRP